MTLRIAAILPSRNHHLRLADIVDRLRALGLGVFIIDDGSDRECADAIAAIAASRADVRLYRSEMNRGKGSAVMQGFDLAAADGFSHAMQIDADGQHDLAAVPTLLDLAREHPDAVISGVPVFDASMPRARRIGRWVTHIWVWIETASLRISDSMCGFRIYPLGPVRQLLAEEVVGQRMDFDTDILVRLHWRGVRIVETPVSVTYPAGNVSNFDLWRDNLRITRMHARLVFAGLGRLAARGWRRLPRAAHWAALPERGAYGGLRLAAAICRLLGRETCLVLISPVVLYFYVSGRPTRRASQDFLARAFRALRAAREPTGRDAFRHHLNFARRIIDTFAAWTGELRPEHVTPVDPAASRAIETDRAGALIIVSHFGSADLARVRLRDIGGRRLTILVHTHHAENWTRLLGEFAPEAMVDLVQVSEIGPETAIMLKERIEAGHWVAIAGDRIPVKGLGDTALAPFLGDPAPFPVGPYLLAYLLGCPTYVLFCMRRGGKYRLWLEPFAPRIELPRGRRREALADYAARYAARLERAVLADPYQWFNFYDFWQEGESAKV